MNHETEVIELHHCDGCDEHVESVTRVQVEGEEPCDWCDDCLHIATNIRPVNFKKL